MAITFFCRQFLHALPPTGYSFVRTRAVPQNVQRLSPIDGFRKIFDRWRCSNTGKYGGVAAHVLVDSSLPGPSHQSRAVSTSSLIELLSGAGERQTRDTGPDERRMGRANSTSTVKYANFLLRLHLFDFHHNSLNALRPVLWKIN